MLSTKKITTYSELIFILLFFIFPYNFLGEEAGVNILLLFILLYLIYMIMKKNIICLKINKLYFFLFFTMMILSLLVSFISSNTIRSLFGVSLFSLCILLYLFIKTIDEEKFITYFVYLITFTTAIAIIYQGVFRELRLSFNFGYANTYSLIICSALILTDTLKNIRYDFYIKTVLITGLFFTGDRTLLLILCFWIIFTYIRSKNLKILINLIMGILQYVILDKAPVLGLFLLPITIPILNYCHLTLLKLSKKYIYVLFPIFTIVLVVARTNLSQRLLNISLNNNSFLGRIISFIDVFNQVPHNLLGKGSNSYEYGQFLIQSAFYETKYIHNSILQQLYDFGILGAILFISFIIFGAYIIIKSNNRLKFYYISIYIIILLHSMMNFDMAFPSIWVLLCTIITFCSSTDNLRISKPLFIPIAIILMIFSITLSFHETTLKLAFNSINKNNEVSALKFLEIQNALKIKDDRIYFIKASAEKLNYDKFNKADSLYAAKADLQTAVILNDMDPRIKWNLAFILTKLHQYNDADNLWKDILSQEGHNIEAYINYYDFINEAFKNDSNLKAKKIKNLSDTYYSKKSNLPPIAKNLPSQLKGTFEETLNIH